MAFEMTLRSAWEIVREDFKQIYSISTSLFSKPCLTLLNFIGNLFIFGQIVILTIMMLFFVRHIVGKMGYPVKKTMQRIYITMATIALLQVMFSSVFIILQVQGVLVLLFVAAVGAYILDP
uniref:Peptidoglycan glycosyltransferase n=1 Tax=Caenorhabditis tropicalis TaxID=1561998 RepID=A0A1I7TC58_9PELO